MAGHQAELKEAQSQLKAWQDKVGRGGVLWNRLKPPRRPGAAMLASTLRQLREGKHDRRATARHQRHPVKEPHPCYCLPAYAPGVGAVGHAARAGAARGGHV